MSNPKKPKSFKFVCRCNGVTEEEVLAAIQSGAKSVDRVGDLCTAGFGACGGSCRPDIQKMIAQNLIKKPN